MVTKRGKEGKRGNRKIDSTGLGLNSINFDDLGRILLDFAGKSGDKDVEEKVKRAMKIIKETRKKKGSNKGDEEGLIDLMCSSPKINIECRIKPPESKTKD